MKKKLALLLAAVMVAAMVPVSAFATSDNHVTNVVTLEKDGKTTDVATPSLIIEEDDKLTAGQQFELKLDGAKWIEGDGSDINWTDDTLDTGGYKFVLIDDRTISVELGASVVSDTAVDKLVLPINAKVTGDEATITVIPCESVVSAGTYVFARTTSSSVTAKVNNTVKIPVGGEKELESIVLTETVKGALKSGEEIKVRLYGDFKFKASTITDSMDVTTVTGLGTEVKPNSVKDDEFILKVTNTAAKAGKLSLKGIVIEDDGADEGDVAEIFISGAGIEDTKLEVATLIGYGYTFTVEDKKLPVFYSGRKYDATDKTLKVTFEEAIKDSWWSSRKTTITFPEGVEVVDVKDLKVENCAITPEVDSKNHNVVNIKTTSHTDKAEWSMKFVLSIDPEFTGDITAVLGGPAVQEDIEVVVAEAQAPVTFEVVSSDVSIDYRNVAIGDIVIKEAFAGALEENSLLKLVIDGIDLEKGAEVEVVEGDAKVKLTTDKGTFVVKTTKESYKAPATIKITNVKAFLDRTLPAGSYALDLVVADVTDADGAHVADTNEGYFKNYKEAKDQKGYFTTDAITLADAYVEVVTAGRDQDDSSFTTQVAITIGASTMQVGQKTIALEVPAYISNGYTMLPVRAVADALSGNSATVLWDDATKTVTIAFGARIISMTIGSKVMNINGVEIQMNAAPEITNNRTFLPVRDLGYALGLTDADIAWDEATATATLN